MKTRILALSLAALCLGLPLSSATAADQGPEASQAQQPIYGSQLMTPAERMEYRNRMRSLNTQEEREALRLEHHQRMQERAKERGLQLPDMPPSRGMGMGMGRGMGPGMGAGGPNRPGR